LIVDVAERRTNIQSTVQKSKINNRQSDLLTLFRPCQSGIADALNRPLKPTFMTTLPQPPPDAPAPPPSEAALRSHRWWRWIWVVGVFSMVAVLAGLTSPLVIRSRKKSDQTEAISNARQIGLALFEFQAEYGKLPDETTIAAVQSQKGSLLPMGTKTSNDFFRQLLASEMTQREGMFYAKGDGVRKPDENINGSAALAKRECGFSYFLGATDTNNPDRPIVVAPMIPGTDRFDPEPFKGKAVILRIDNSVTSGLIDEHGHVILNGRNMMDPHHPIWEGHAPTIAWPDF
jgi:type II secretory pathway pseudopilin PulG